MKHIQQIKYPAAFESFESIEQCDCPCHRDPSIIHFVACCGNNKKISKTINNSRVEWVGKYIY
jgi:hypothetical protein